ncbi:SDR family NAD(P)-dependent oxidoreductase, partial [Streptomyces sp. NPDC001020]
RAVVVGQDRAELLAGLDALARDETTDHLVTGVADRDSGTVFVFPGQGSQWAGMARELLDTSPVFSERIADCSRALAPYTDWSLSDVLRGAPKAPGLDRVDVVQPALFAVMVSLAAVWRSLGVVPDAVVGHSQGEIAAAHVAGALGLDDAARVVALRSRAIAAQAGGGGMAAVALPADEVRSLADGLRGQVYVATVNGPSSTTVAADTDALEELLAACAAAGVDARRVAVDYASHSPHVEPLEDELLKVLDGITPTASAVPFYSTVTGEVLDTAALDAAYWYRNLRHTVLFDQATRALLADGHRTFVEISPHPVLTAAVQDTAAAAAGEGPGREPLVTGTLRRDDGGLRRFLLSAAHVHTHGTVVDWSAVPGAPDGDGTVDLPTYAFQRDRYWLGSGSATADVSAAGLTASEHPLLGAAVPLADGGGLVLTGVLGPDALAAPDGSEAPESRWDAILTDLVLHAADRAGCLWTDDLTLHTPLAPDTAAGRRLQVTVRAADASGRRRVTVHSRPDDAEDTEWTCHAEATVNPADGASADGDALAGAAWPPTGASPYVPGPDAAADAWEDAVARGVRSAWTLDGDLYAEVALDGEPAEDPAGFAVHPALLSAVLATASAHVVGGTPTRAVARWAGLRLSATGATVLRVRLTPLSEDRYRLLAAGPDGRPVLTARSLTLGAPTGETVAPRGAGRLFQLGWPEWPAPDTAVPTGTWTLVGDGAAELGPVLERAGVTVRICPDPAVLGPAADEGPGEAAPTAVLFAPAGPDTAAGDDRTSSCDPAGEALRATEAVLGLLRTWLSDGEEATGDTPLAVLTRDAVATRPGEDVTSLSGAAVWGLVRSAQAEHPGRLLLVDLDGSDASLRALPAVLAAREPQTAVRDGRLHVPRLSREGSAPRPAATAPDPAGTVLVTGGTGTLGRIVTRHLVRTHGMRHLLLTSRSGPGAPDLGPFLDEIAGAGAEATVVACDAADPDALRAVLEDIPADRPLTAVVHAAGVLDDATVHALTTDQLRRVMRPKADAAWNLHRLTSGLDLAAFVLFSSVTGVVGTPGQANYAAANAFLDALAQHRDAAGLPATGLAWGYWEVASGMTGHLSHADVARMARTGVEPLPTDEALALLDEALAAGRPFAVPARIPARAPHGGPLPAVLRTLVRTPLPRAASSVATPSAPESWAERLAPLSPAEQHALLLDLVGTHATVVLGGARRAFDADRAFKELGFDSLTAVELRNRLAAATGLRLPATLVFNHPTAAVLAAHLRGLLAPAAQPADDASPLARLHSLEAAVDSLDPADTDTRDTIATRLQALLRIVERPAGTDAESPGDDLTDAILSATPDEILALLDSRIGRPSGAGSDTQGDRS